MTQPLSEQNPSRPLWPRQWTEENFVLYKLRFCRDVVAPFSPPCEGGVRGVVPARPITTSYPSRCLSVRSHPCCETRRPAFDLQGCGITPPAPPSQGGERNCPLATSCRRGQQGPASGNSPYNSVSTNFSRARCAGMLGERSRSPCLHASSARPDHWPLAALLSPRCSTSHAPWS